MGKKGHLEPARSVLFVSEIADAEREKFCISDLSKEVWKTSRYTGLFRALDMN